MPAASDRLEFAPPPQPALIRSAGLAIVAHLLLLAALTWGINWKRQTEETAVEAELWRAVPQAAPREEPPPPPPPPQPQPQPAPEPPRAAPAPEPDPRADAIALEREKKRRLEERREREAEQERRDREKRAELKKREAEKAQQERRAAEDKRKADAAKERTAQAEAKQAEARRQEHLRRVQDMADPKPAPSPPSAGPSANYGDRIRARIKPNIVFADAIAGNPLAEVIVRVAPDGTIVGRRLSKSSGVKAWDDAVLRAIDKTEVLPRDVDGRVVPEIAISFRPKDL